jgi:hypothetical protein
MYPISQSVPLIHNPIASVWLPAVLEDEVGIHTIVFSCAMHHFLGSGHTSFKDSELLMTVILRKLNRRMTSEVYSDVTIGAVSCLALCENHLGNHRKWRMHAAGMAEMVKSRGGFQSVREVLRMKIYKADTIGAVDTLSDPNFPRPIRTVGTLFSSVDVEAPKPSIEELLAEVGLSQVAMDALVELSHLCQALNHAVETQTPIDPQAFDEDVTCIQHDLLRSLKFTDGPTERLCIITSLVFVQMLTRETPFTRLCSSHISEQLQQVTSATDIAKAPTQLMFWMLFVGGLVASQTKEKGWFLTRLRQFQRARDNIPDWELAKAELQKVLWVGRIQDRYGLQLWADMNPLGNLDEGL